MTENVWATVTRHVLDDLYTTTGNKQDLTTDNMTAYNFGKYLIIDYHKELAKIMNKPKVLYNEMLLVFMTFGAYENIGFYSETRGKWKTKGVDSGFDCYLNKSTGFYELYCLGNTNAKYSKHINEILHTINKAKGDFDKWQENN